MSFEIYHEQVDGILKIWQTGGSFQAGSRSTCPQLGLGLTRYKLSHLPLDVQCHYFLFPKILFYHFPQHPFLNDDYTMNAKPTGTILVLAECFEWVSAIVFQRWLSGVDGGLCQTMIRLTGECKFNLNWWPGRHQICCRRRACLVAIM